jgi:hypothetical protein
MQKATTNMFLNRADIEKIKDVLDQFPDLDIFELEQDSSSGIGSITTMTFAREINGLRGSFEIEVSGLENW